MSAAILSLAKRAVIRFWEIFDMIQTQHLEKLATMKSILNRIS